eukprot:6175930-Pleurochrysis_carterae.AAC.2
MPPDPIRIRNSFSPPLTFPLTLRTSFAHPLHLPSSSNRTALVLSLSLAPLTAALSLKRASSQEIDGFDTVVRFNSFVTRALEDHTGSKTTLWCHMMQWYHVATVEVANKTPWVPTCYAWNHVVLSMSAEHRRPPPLTRLLSPASCRPRALCACCALSACAPASFPRRRVPLQVVALNGLAHSSLSR